MIEEWAVLVVLVNSPLILLSRTISIPLERTWPSSLDFYPARLMGGLILVPNGYFLSKEVETYRREAIEIVIPSNSVDSLVWETKSEYLSFNLKPDVVTSCWALSSTLSDQHKYATREVERTVKLR